jgi:Holliday junction DNA helicase RuvA
VIAKLKGKIEDLKPTEIVVDVGGVCYHAHIPFTTYKQVQDQKDVALNIYTFVREDQLKLYGFCSESEKRLFEVLIKVNGIGPAMALSILSGIGINEFINAIEMSKVVLLQKIPGIGKTKAEKIIFELKRKIKVLKELSTSEDFSSSIKGDALEALVSLGFDERKSNQVIDDIISSTENIPLEDVVKISLQQLSQ